MSKEKIKVYLYTRVSTTMQIDGYSLDAQKTKMKAFCDYNEYEIASEYEDAGKSGKSIEGRIAFNQMMDDIKSGKDEVSYVLVFKLSRFGRNAADVLATLQVMQDFGVNLICVEDGIDSSKDAGKLMISVLSAVAEIERENIRVSTTMQIDGYSLDAQKTKMKAFCDYNEYEIASEYEDAGKSGKSIEGRIAFNQMMDDIKSGKDEVSYVLVFKLSRFGRNAADVLATLQVMQDFGVNLICVEDGIDSSKDAGKLMISVLSAVAEIERENIRVQTMEGRMQKAREGKWNGGFI